MKWKKGGTMPLVNRPKYLAFLKDFRDQHLIKVIAGVRRSGKSTLLELFRNHLKETGVADEQIICVNFENIEFESLHDYRLLYQYLKDRLSAQKTYIFLDEIQHVTDFEKAVDALYILPNVDLYITGSNAFFMSGELATLLSGRYVQLEILPLSFKEFVDWHRQFGKSQALLPELFELYSATAFPQALFLPNERTVTAYLDSLYATILLKDVVTRLKVSDVAVLEQVVRFLLSVVGAPISLNKVKNTLTSNQHPISSDTLKKYVRGLEDALLFYRVPRYKIRGKALLNRNEKYYPVDVGLRRLLLPDANKDYGHIIENIVFLELKRRYQAVYVGAVDDYEVDFVALDAQRNVSYYQVSLSTMDETTLARELRPLQAISDNNPKYLLTLDTFNAKADYDGIQKLPLLEWLMS
jgi:predicted AAA+ superfamily ATPase